MSSTALKRWVWVHTWSSLVCTAFVLMLCITGLPLIFHSEIDSLLSSDDWKPANPGGIHLSLDEILSVAGQHRPDDVPIYMSFDVDRPVINVTTGPSADVSGFDMHFASYDATSGDLVLSDNVGEGVMDFLLQLHTDMFLGLPGMLFLGFMGFLLIVATISGIVLYVPFMQKLTFGDIRRDRSAKLKWLDYHNLFGAITLAWVLVVGVTGVINTLESPILDKWRDQVLAEMIAENQETQVVPVHASLSDAVDSALKLAPNMQLQFVAFPGSEYSTDAHYSVFLHGRTPLTEHLVTPVLIRADTGQIDGRRDMPLFAKALSLSRPLHFGDYGGLALKILWAVLDLLTIHILCTGLYLWWRKGASGRAEKQPSGQSGNDSMS